MTLRTEIPTTTIPGTSFTTAGFAAAGDPGSGAIYVRGQTQFLDPIQDAAGVWWQLAPWQRMRPEYWGGFAAYTSDQTQAFLLAIQAALTQPGSNIGATVYAENPAGYDVTNLFLQNAVKLKFAPGTPVRCHATGGACVTTYGTDSEVSGAAFQRASAGGTGTLVVGVQMAYNEQGQHQAVRDCSFDGFDIGIDVVCGALWTIERNNIQNSVYDGIRIRNIRNADIGDGLIANNAISNASGGDAGIKYQSGGGLKLDSNKILGFARGIDCMIDDGADTVDLLVLGNSVENQSIAGMRTGHAGRGTFGTVTITGNEFGGAPVGYSAEPGVSNITYTANAHNVCSQAGVVVNDGTEALIVDGSNTYVGCPATIIDARSGFTGAKIVYDAVKGLEMAPGAWNNLARLALSPYRAAVVSIVAEGVLQGVASALRTFRAGLRHTGAAVEVSVLDGISTGAALDINIDTVSSPGSAILQVRSNPNAGGTAFEGSATVGVSGRLLAYYPQ